MSPNSRSLDDAAAQDVWPRKLLAKLTSPIGTAVILGAFAVYALAFYLKFNVPRPDGGVDGLLLFGLISQFVGLLCLLVIFRALRDGRLFEFFFVFVFVMPLNSIAMQAAIHASSGTPLTMEMLFRSSFLFNATFFSPLMWLVLGAGVIAFAVVLVIDARRQRARRVG
ncbi:MAG: hypothetical protein SF172_16730 [Burkholderiales bacterium]|nr:hypothetical protein [Burkholderiales bacterium]